MTNPITQARMDVASALGDIAGIQVFDFIPESLTPPAALVTPGVPYVHPGQVMGEFEVTLNVRLFAAVGTNEVITKALDELIVNVCNALQPFGVSSVSTPGIDRESYGSPYLVTDITIITTYQEVN